MNVKRILIAFPTLLMLAGFAELSAEEFDGLAILQQMGSQGQFARPDQKLYIQCFRKFNELDANQDGSLSSQEVSKKQKREQKPVGPPFSASRFKAADKDGDGLLAHDEFQQYLVIELDAITIFYRMDANHDGLVSRAEFMSGSNIDDAKLAETAFARFETGQDGSLALEEVLPLWDAWARTEKPPVTARLVVKQQRYPLVAKYQLDAFRQRIKAETDVEKLPPAPKVDLILELTNTGNQALSVWPGGGIEDPVVMVRGDGLLRPESLEGGGGGSGATTPQPVIQPGKTFRVRIRSLNPSGVGYDHVYWTKPGEYQISASYPVYKNLPPHLPELFPNQPQPTGGVKRYVVTSEPVTVFVVNAENPGNDSVN